MIERIYITGPESSGKTTLAKALAKSFHTVWVPEYARTYLERLNRPYQKSDLLEIAKAQAKWEDGAERTANNYLFCDTGMLVLKVWSEVRFGSANKFIVNRMKQQAKSMHLLCKPDIPWVADPFRENPHERNELFEYYRETLETMGIPYQIIEGQEKTERLQLAQTHLPSK